ncbi:MAG: hypothetical protein QF645_03465 [Planctomycetota bacterium]|nr:hypothetical protein [Planctomycetota bacterium]
MKTTVIAVATILMGTLAGQANAHPGDHHSKTVEKQKKGKWKARKARLKENTSCCVQTGEREVTDKVRAIIGHKEVTEWKTETRFREESRCRTIKKFREETRYRNITKYRWVTRYRTEWKTRYVPGFQSQPRRIMAGTNRYGQPIYRNSYGRVACYVPQRYQARVPYQVKEAYTVREAFCVKVPYEVEEHYTVRVPYEVKVAVKKRIPVYGFKRVKKMEPVFACLMH